jgi:hypothetical protein
LETKGLTSSKQSIKMHKEQTGKEDSIEIDADCLIEITQNFIYSSLIT